MFLAHRPCASGWLLLGVCCLGVCEAMSPFETLPCEAGQPEAGVQILWPHRDQRLAPTLAPTRIRTRIHGQFTIRKDGYIMALVAGVDKSHGDSVTIIDTMVSPHLNLELFGLQTGFYVAQVALVDTNRKSRTCWKTDRVSFSISQRVDQSNRSAALQRNLGLYREYSYNTKLKDQEKYLPQPSSSKDFAYVTILWTDDFVDNAIVWATSLMATGSTFRRICLTGRGRIAKSRMTILSRCCCEIAIIDPIHPPASSNGSTPHYALLLTKLRVFQLDKKGLRKIVMMDSDTLVLQNIDELFWLPSPSVAVEMDTLMGETRKAKMNAGVMVLEPDSEKFDQMMESTSAVLSGKKSKLLDQDVLDAFFGHSYSILPMTYNLYPELLDLMPFLHVVDDLKGNSSMWPSLDLPMDNGIKVVHFWHNWNPFLINKFKGSHALQVNARRIHNQMWRWYIIFWRLHQEGLKRGAPEDYPKWLSRCHQTTKQFGTQSDKFVPIALGDQCRHIHGMAW